MLQTRQNWGEFQRWRGGGPLVSPLFFFKTPGRFGGRDLFCEVTSALAIVLLSTSHASALSLKGSRGSEVGFALFQRCILIVT